MHFRNVNDCDRSKLVREVRRTDKYSLILIEFRSYFKDYGPNCFPFSVNYVFRRGSSPKWLQNNVHLMTSMRTSRVCVPLQASKHAVVLHE